MMSNDQARSARAAPPVRLPPVPYPYGVHTATDGLGGVAAPLLAGFAVALLGLVLQVDTQMRWPGTALFLFAASAVLFLQVVQLNARARGFVVSFRQALDWYPDADDPERRARVLDEVWQHDAKWRFWIRRARVLYNVGIVLLLLGTAVLLVPAGLRDLTFMRWSAIVVALLGAGYELLAMLGSWLQRTDRFRPPRWVLIPLRIVAPAEPGSSR
jgi:hypothetical protein